MPPSNCTCQPKIRRFSPLSDWAQYLYLRQRNAEDWNTPGDDIMSGEVFEAYDNYPWLFNTGINHSIQLDGQSYLKSSVSYSAEGIDDDVRQRTDRWAWAR